MMPRNAFAAAIAISLIGHIAVLACMGNFEIIPLPGTEIVFDIQIEDYEEMAAVSPSVESPPPTPPDAHNETTADTKSKNVDTARTSPQPAGEDTVNLDSRNSKYTPYLLSLRRKIESSWKYPYLAYANHESGTTILTFSINARGDIANPMVAVSSGSHRLDEESLRTVRAASPYPPLPRQFRLAKLNIIAQFRYQLPE